MNRKNKSKLHQSLVWRIPFCIVMLFILLIHASCQESPDAAFKRLDREGDVAYEQGDFISAVAYWLDARTIQNAQAVINTKIGRAYMRLADFNLAKSAFEEALIEQPDNWRLKLEIAKIQILNLDFEAAKSIGESIKEHVNEPAVHVLHGDLMMLGQKYDMAEKAYKKTLKIRPNDNAAQVRLAICYLFQNKDLLAEEIYWELAAQNPSSPEVLIQMGKYWKIKGDIDKAEEFIKQAALNSPNDLAYKRELAEFYYEAEMYAKAYSTLDAMHQKNPSNRYINKFLIDTLLLQNRFQEAKSLLKTFSQKSLGDLDWNLLKGKYHLLSREAIHAVYHFSSVLDKEPNFPAAHYLLALAHLTGGQSNLARQSVMRALTLDPEFVEAELLLADIYYKKREYNLSIEHALRIIKKEPENYRAHLIAGNADLSLRKYQDALKRFAAARLLNPDLVAPIYYMAMTFEKSGQNKKASELYRQILDHHPETVDAATRYAELLIKEKKIQEAIQIYKDLVSKNPQNAMFHLILGDIFKYAGDLDNAGAHFEKAITIQPAMPSAYVRLKEIFEKHKNKEGLIRILQKGMEKNPTFPFVYIELAKIYGKDGRFEESRDIIERAVQVNPESPQLANSLAWLYLEQDVNIDKAYMYAQMAYERLPHDPSVVDTLGWAYYKKNSLTRAMWLLNEALSLEPDNPLINYHLGVVYAARNDVIEAKKAIMKALKKGLPPKEKNHARSLLDSMSSAG